MTFHPALRDFDPIAVSAEFASRNLPDRLGIVRTAVPGRLVFTTSFGLEDQALTHAIVESGIPVAFATLDTGRLFDETLELWAETEMRYGIRIQAFVPDGAEVQRLVSRDGPLGFRRSPEGRQACCAVRKVEPLGRALADASGWLTGLRSDQSSARSGTDFITIDAERGLAKVSPLADWSREEVARYVRDNAIPYNPLHDQGFLSIGCAPCTRAVRAGEPERAGRWWWETETKKECGLHDRARRLAAEPVPALA